MLQLLLAVRGFAIRVTVEILFQNVTLDQYILFSVTLVESQSMSPSVENNIWSILTVII